MIHGYRPAVVEGIPHDLVETATSHRVLSVIHAPTFGGPHNQALGLSRELVRSGFDTSVIMPKDGEIAAARLRAAGILVELLPLVRPRATLDPRAFLRFALGFYPNIVAIRRVIKRLKPDIIQVHGLLAPQAAIAGRLEGLGVVWQLIDTRPPKYLRWLLTPLVLALADVVMTTGNRVAQMYPGVDSFGSRLVPYCPPVDLTLFRPSTVLRSATRRALGLNGESIVVGAVGNRNRQKGYEYLIRAISPLRVNHSDLVLRILGNKTPGHQDYDGRLETELARANLGADAIRAVPSGFSVADVMNSIDILVTPSVPLSEGIPTVVVEAMACGLPVVVSDVGSVCEVVDNEVTGFVVPPCDVAALSTAISRLVSDRELRREMGARAATISKDRGIASCAATHVGAYRTALARRSARG